MKTNNNFTILIVDDEKFNIELVVAYLGDEGYKLSFALGAQGALEIVKQKKIDLILLDINMPKMDGFELCRILKEEGKTKDIPVIFLTAQSNIEYISQAFEVGGVDYLTKPFNGDELKVRVRTHLQNLAYLQEIQKKQSKLAQLSVTDSLTKLHNALYFDAQLKAKQTKEEKFWFVYIKIERFEKINRVYGFNASNKLIRLFAKLLQSVTPANTIVARLYGVSFAFLLKDYDVQLMRSIYESLTLELAKDKNLNKALHFSLVFYNVKNKEATVPMLYKSVQSALEELEHKSENYLFI